jgi:hypothetical protein
LEEQHQTLLDRSETQLQDEMERNSVITNDLILRTQQLEELVKCRDETIQRLEEQLQHLDRKEK